MPRGQGVASHRTAAALWHLRGFETGLIEITVPNRRRPDLAGVVCHSTDRLDKADVTRLGVIPITRVGRTLLDVGAVAPDLVAGALENALHRGLASVASLERLLVRVGGNGRRGTAVLRRLLDERDPDQAPTESALEDAFVVLLRRYRMRQPVRQYRLALPNGRQVRLDFADPEINSTSRSTEPGGTRHPWTPDAIAGETIFWPPSAGPSCGSTGTTCAGAEPRSPTT